jgi:hypothetical protein
MRGVAVRVVDGIESITAGPALAAREFASGQSVDAPVLRRACRSGTAIFDRQARRAASRRRGHKVVQT